MRRSGWLFFFPVLFSACLNDCPRGFEPQSLVNRLRVLGVQAEPAEILWELDQDPRPVKLTALVVDPQGGGRGVEASFRYCPLLTEPPALRQVSELPPIIGPDELDCPRDSEPQLRPLGPLSARFDALEAVSHYGKPSPLGLYRVGFELAAGEERVRGYRTLGLSLFAPPNSNPLLTELELDGVRVTDEPLLQVGLGQPHVLQAIPDPASFESYAAPGEEPRTESLRFSFHATFGQLELHGTQTADGGATLDESRASWVPPQDDPLTGFKVPEAGMEVTFYVVARDDRGGIGWISRKIRVLRTSP